MRVPVGYAATPEWSYLGPVEFAFGICVGVWLIWLLWTRRGQRDPYEDELQLRIAAWDARTGDGAAAQRRNDDARERQAVALGRVLLLLSLLLAVGFVFWTIGDGPSRAADVGLLVVILALLIIVLRLERLGRAGVAFPLHRVARFSSRKAHE